MTDGHTPDLIERIEAASEGDRDLDCEIALAVDGGEIVWLTANGTMDQYPVRKYESANHVGGVGKAPVPNYTGSIDAAMSLMPGGRRMTVQQRRSYEPFWVSFMLDGGTEYDATGKAGTLALAITAASLKARAIPRAQQGNEFSLSRQQERMDDVARQGGGEI